MDRFEPQWFARRAVVPVARLLTRYYRARVYGDELIPRTAPVIYVGKHPRSYLYLETMLLGLFAYWDAARPPFRVLESTHAAAQRTPLHDWFRHQVGAVPATEESALAALRSGESLLIFPGGTRELYGAPDRLRWDGRLGYARLAFAAQVPVVPFAIVGADQQHLGRLAVGGSSIWFPPVPLPVRLDFHFGAPIPPPTCDADDAVAAYASDVRCATEALLAHGIARRRAQ